jgi:sugar (pentulose or hexulose) kinase
MTGTTMAIYLPTDSIPEYKADSFVPCHYSFDGSYALLSWSPTAGMALKWFREAFLKDVSFRELDALAESVGSIVNQSNELTKILTDENGIID